MINIDLKTNPELYFDYREGLRFLRGVRDEDYAYREEVTLFHVYTEVRTPKELLSIKSFLATQNLQKTKLIVWSDYDISGQDNIQPYKGLVEFRVYNPKELAKGTPLEGSLSHMKVGGDKNHWMSSGVMRFLVLYKFGGVYFDMDMVLLRDFKPILGQDYAYQWGGSTDFAKVRPWEGDCHGPCAALMGATVGGEFINNCMAKLVNTQPTGETCFDEDLLGKVYREAPFTVFPSTFFNTEWLISKVNKKRSQDSDAEMFDKVMVDPDELHNGPFAWHWHNSHNKHKVVVPGSKFDFLSKLIDEKLSRR